MRIRQRADGKNPADSGRKCKGRPEIAALAMTSPSERLEYIAAMVRELKMMSAQADLATLTSLLDLAYQEALQCRRASE